MAVVDYFLKIAGCPGESEDAQGHKDEIQLESWSFGETQSGTFSFGSGGGAGKVQMQDFHFVMKVNKASPKLFLACANGEHFDNAILTCRKAGKNPMEFYKVTFSHCIVSSFQTSGSGSADVLPMEQISLNFDKVEIEYKMQADSGSPGGQVRAAYDLRKSQSS